MEAYFVDSVGPSGRGMIPVPVEASAAEEEAQVNEPVAKEEAPVEEVPKKTPRKKKTDKV